MSSDQATPSRSEPRGIEFLAGFSGSRAPPPSSVASSKKTKKAEAEAKKRKAATSEAQPPKRPKTKKLMPPVSAQVPQPPPVTSSTPATQQEPLQVTPISVAPPASENQERQVILHESATTKTPAADDIPAAENFMAEDIAPKAHTDEANVKGENPMLNTDAPVIQTPTHDDSEYVDISTPLRPSVPENIPSTPPSAFSTPVPRTPESPFVAREVEPTEHASPLKRLRRGPRLDTSSIQSIPEDEFRVSPTAPVDGVLRIRDIAYNVPENEGPASEDNAAENIVGEVNAPSPDGPPVPTTPSSDDNGDNIVLARNREGQMVPTKWPRLKDGNFIHEHGYPTRMDRVWIS